MIVDGKELWGVELHDYIGKKHAEIEFLVGSGKMSPPSIFDSNLPCADLCRCGSFGRVRPLMTIKILIQKHNGDWLKIFEDLNIGVEINFKTIKELGFQNLQIYMVLLGFSRCLSIEEIDYDEIHNTLDIELDEFVSGMLFLQKHIVQGVLWDYPLLISRFSDMELQNILERKC